MFSSRELNRSQLAPGLAQTAPRGAFKTLARIREQRRPSLRSFRGSTPTSPSVATRPGSIWPLETRQTRSHTERIRRRGKLQQGVQSRRTARSIHALQGLVTPFFQNFSALFRGPFLEAGLTTFCVLSRATTTSSSCRPGPPPTWVFRKRELDDRLKHACDILRILEGGARYSWRGTGAFVRTPSASAGSEGPAYRGAGPSLALRVRIMRRRVPPT